MLDVEYKGGNTVVLKTKNTTVVVDPKRSVFGGKDTLEKGAIELVTESRFQIGSPDAHIILDGPGEYEVEDFSIRGIPAKRHIDQETAGNESTIYRVEAGDVKLAVVGNIAGPLDDDQLEAVGVVDILIVPVGGGGYTLDATAAVALVRTIDPRVVIPVHYNDSALAYEVPQSDIDEFVAEMGVSVEKVGEKYRLKSVGALPESLTIIEIARTA